MERIKDLSKLIIQEDMVLVKIVEKSNLVTLVTKDGTPEIDYNVVVLKGNKVTRLNVGDIVVHISQQMLEVYDYKGEKYALIPEFTVKMAVKPEDFDNTYIAPKIDLKIN